MNAVEFELSTILYAFGLTLFAGLATGIGSAMAFFADRTRTGFLCASLGFSAGVMLYVSFVEILAKSRDSLVQVYGDPFGSWLAVMSFFGGMAVIAIIDKLVPSIENPHEMHRVEEMDEVTPEKARLYRMGVFTALAVGLHNFPEGLATFTAALSDPGLGTAVAGAVAIHNIPEGIAVSVPIFYATGSRRKAFRYSFLSGVSEPVGAALGWLVLFSFFNETVFGVVFGGAAGIMVFISLDQLLPTAREYGEHHLAVYGLTMGMAVMAVSLLLFL